MLDTGIKTHVDSDKEKADTNASYPTAPQDYHDPRMFLRDFFVLDEACAGDLHSEK